MRLAAVYCVWADCLDLLKKSVQNILHVVDQVIIVWSHSSNHNNKHDGCLKYILATTDPKITFSQCEPVVGMKPHENECRKRNHGLSLARQLEFTHFIMMDGDEFYEQSEFEVEKEDIIKRDVLGMVCRTKVYFGKPDLTIGYDHTLVPFIHKITPGLKFQLNSKSYPFAYNKENQAMIDPTRRLSISDGVEWSNITMHHYSYVRSEIDLKINNSSANLKRSEETIKRDLLNATDGYYCELYHRNLTTSENIFNI